eukprot:4579780-Pleurochrysis_carterae.AAC.1
MGARVPPPRARAHAVRAFPRARAPCVRSRVRACGAHACARASRNCRSTQTCPGRMSASSLASEANITSWMLEASSTSSACEIRGHRASTQTHSLSRTTNTDTQRHTNARNDGHDASTTPTTVALAPLTGCATTIYTPLPAGARPIGERCGVPQSRKTRRGCRNRAAPARQQHTPLVARAERPSSTTQHTHTLTFSVSCFCVCLALCVSFSNTYTH